MSHDWWRDAVVYQVYPRSFADSNGDGMGDLAGVTEKLPYLSHLGVDAIWLSPFYPSPQHDAGYDVSDYCDVDPRFGTLADFDDLAREAHARGIKVIADVVPNHASSEHALFRKALESAPGSPERDLFVFRDGRGRRGEEPPNNWHSIFHGRAWTRVTEADGHQGQWYLHIFDSTQPDWNWENPAVHALFEDVLRFWLDRGVDGFRVDVAHGMIKADGLPDAEHDAQGLVQFNEEYTPPYFDQDGVHDIYREWRRVLDSYDDRMMVGEAWVPGGRMSRYLREGEMHQVFNFSFLEADWTAASLRGTIADSLRAATEVGAPTTWVLSNHDVIRHATRLGYPRGTELPDGIGVGDPQPDRALGLRRARAATLLMLSLPGSAYLYNGEELGLPEVTNLPDDVREDPAYFRSHGKHRGRDGCRVPLPWIAAAPSFGFSPALDGSKDSRETAPWLPQPDYFGMYAADQQEGITGSTLEMYRAMLAFRRQHQLGSGEVEWLSGYPADVLALRNRDVTVLANTSDGDLTVAMPGTVQIASGPVAGLVLPANTTVVLA